MMENETNWPIYSLANYSGGGSLLKICSRHLASRNSELQKKSSTDDSISINPIKPTRHQKTNKPDELKLSWWQLIEPDRGPSCCGVESFRNHVLSLCTNLCKAVSPFLEVRTTDKDQEVDEPLISSPKSVKLLEGEPSVVKDTCERRLFNAGLRQQQQQQRELLYENAAQSELLESLNAARLRRTSWRRNARPQSSEKLSKRQLAPLGKTLSVAEIPSSGDRRTNNLVCQPPTKRETYIARWLRSAGYSRRAEGDWTSFMHRWSKLSKLRGKYGESLVHILIANQSNAHLILLVLLIELWPELSLDVFASTKFNGLSCVHLSIAYGNERLLQYLISIGERNTWTSELVEQQATGSLFAPQELKGSSSAARKDPRAKLASAPRKTNNKVADTQISLVDLAESGQVYWCDQAAHWPAPNGRAHLLIFADDSDNLTPSADQMTTGDSDTCASEPPIYLGSTPLAWSVGHGSRQMYGHLVDAGADQQSRDSLGRTCLHLLAVNNVRGWSRFLVKSGARQLATDHQSRTPLQLACHLGRAELFDEILELSAVEFWSYSMIRCSGYPLTQLDSILAGDQSAVAAILESKVSTDEQKARLLSSGVVKRLLEEKWQTFARRLFYRELLLTLAHLSLMTLAISLRPNADSSKRPDSLRSAVQVIRTENGTASSEGEVATASWWLKLAEANQQQQLVRHLAELATVALAAVQLIGLGKEWRQDGSIGRQWTYNPLLPNFVSSNGFILLCVPLRLTSIWHSDSYEDQHPQGIGRQLALAEDVLLIFAAPLLWSTLLFFIAAFRVTGPFVAMIRHMIVFDLRQFSLIYLVFLFAFAQCIFFINYQQQQPQQSVDLPKSADDQIDMTFVGRLIADYFQLLMDLFKMTLGVYDLQPFRHSHLARLFFLFFIYLIPILFNMLIAMMNNTYSLIISQSERAWSFQWARTLFALERRLSQKEKDAYLRSYSINMAAPTPAPADSPADNAAEAETFSSAGQKLESAKKFVPALMIIKRMDRTRAERRRRVVGYWQIHKSNLVCCENKLSDKTKKSLRAILDGNLAPPLAV